jgi:lipoyl(octanoyl) transferase
MLFWSLRSENSEGKESPTVSYEDVRALQLKLVELRALDLIEDTVLFLEHDAIVTQGRGLQVSSKDAVATDTTNPKLRHMPLPKLPANVAFAESERGGDLTFHGPGQLVIYPICKLDGKGLAPFHDVHGFIRKMERIFMEQIDLLLEPVQAKTEQVEDATGVWVRAKGEAKASKKIASMGIAVRKWVTYHGLSLNFVNDLKFYSLISPCGYAPEVMTRVSDWIKVDEKNWRQGIEQELAAAFEAESMDGQAPYVETIQFGKLKALIDKIEADARSLAGQI